MFLQQHALYWVVTVLHFGLLIADLRFSVSDADVASATEWSFGFAEVAEHELRTAVMIVLGVLEHGLKFVGEDFAAVGIDAGGEVHLGLARYGEMHYAYALGRDIADDVLFGEGDERAVDGELRATEVFGEARQMDELRFSEDARITAHQSAEQTLLEGGFVQVVEVFLIQGDAYARLEILFVVVDDISRIRQQLQGRVGGQER